MGTDNTPRFAISVLNFAPTGFLAHLLLVSAYLVGGFILAAILSYQAKQSG